MDGVRWITFYLGYPAALARDGRITNGTMTAISVNPDHMAEGSGSGDASANGKASHSHQSASTADPARSRWYCRGCR